MPGSQLMPASGGRALGVGGAHGAGCGRARCGCVRAHSSSLSSWCLAPPLPMVRGAALRRERCGGATLTPRFREKFGGVRQLPRRANVAGWFVTPVGVAAASRRSLHSTSSLNESCSGCEWPRSALRRARTARCQAQSASPAFDRGVPGADRRGRSGRSSS